MLLFQAEADADRLLQLPKEFDPSHDLIEFRRSAFRERYNTNHDCLKDVAR